MAIRAVVLDIGSVLEIIDDSVFPGPWEKRLDLGSGGFARAVDGLAGNPLTGEVTGQQMAAHWQRSLGLDDARTAELVEDFWRWYVGTLDRELYDWFSTLRPTLRTGLLSNSAPDARERERCHDFEAVTDDIVYSHEVGLAKPDPDIYSLTAGRLGVSPHQIVFVDDVEGHLEAARVCGWHGVRHHEGDATTTIAAVEQVIHDQQMVTT